MTCEEEPTPSDALGISCPWAFPTQLTPHLPTTPRRQHLVALSQFPPELLHQARCREPVLGGTLLACPLPVASRVAPKSTPPPTRSLRALTQQHITSGREPLLTTHRGIACSQPFLAAPSAPRPAQRHVLPSPVCCLIHRLHHPPWKDAGENVFPLATPPVVPLDPVLLPDVAPGSISKGKSHSQAASVNGDGFGSPIGSGCSIQARNSARFLRGKSWGSRALPSSFCCRAETQLGPSASQDEGFGG